MNTSQKKRFKIHFEFWMIPAFQEELCSFNYALALRHFSYKVLRSQFEVLLANAFGTRDL